MVSRQGGREVYDSINNNGSSIRIINNEENLKESLEELYFIYCKLIRRGYLMKMKEIIREK